MKMFYEGLGLMVAACIGCALAVLWAKFEEHMIREFARQSREATSVVEVTEAKPSSHVEHFLNDMKENSR